MSTVLVRTFVVLSLLPLLVLTACGGSGHNRADVDFAAMMVPHHRQAVAMSDLLLAKPDIDADVRDLATRIKGEQAPEIAQMTGWLDQWGEPAPAEDGMGGMSGGGMMSQPEIDALGAAQGAQARTLFLQGMVRHHEGAVAMAKTEIASGENDDAVDLATSIVSSQQREIDEMKALLAG